ncbi:MAG TPA: CaiB/BaiF CoA-transferase family protein [Thermoanaerobaculia bacterium]|jgi:crotonobetainyl-CoA:carnitine CoA-transferase CaiB-like acyl-CoA transferase|nr:CaiB/BaiF CoA-transferase family protein [Thermoanaerobaculia bacterium]
MTSASPLQGLLVVDLTRHLPGPLAARLLADLGARIVKVEEPSAGDPVRAAAPLVDGKSPLAAMLLAGVESVALDLKQPAAVEALRGLLAHADVLLESFRPGTMARLGLAPDVLRERYPRLVICSLTGWGQSGPYASRAGHDITYQAIGGALAATGTAPAIQVADVVGAWSAASAVLAALLARERVPGASARRAQEPEAGEGGGTWIDQALLDAAVHANVTGWAGEAAAPREVGEPLPLTGVLPCYGVYPTRGGGALAVGALEPHFWARFCAAAERPDLVDAQYATGERAHDNVAKLVASRTRDEWVELLAAHDVPAEPVLSLAEAAAHPQVAARGVLHRAADGLPRLGFPARFDDARPRAPESVPELGAHTAAVLAEHDLIAGRSTRELREAGIGPQRTRSGWLRRVLRRFRRR